MFRYGTYNPLDRDWVTPTLPTTPVFVASCLVPLKFANDTRSSNEALRADMLYFS